MRRHDHEVERDKIAQEVLQIDFHEFVRLAPLLSDVELANEFQVDPKDASLLKSRLQRG